MRRRPSAIHATTVIPAPARNVLCGPNASHSPPASALATSSATPQARLNTPNALPRRSAGAWVGDQRREQALRESHVQPPERRAGEEQRQRRSRRPVRGQLRPARRGRAASRRAPWPRSIAEPAGIGDRRVDQRHHHHHPRRLRHRQPDVLRPQHQERLGKARQRQQRRDARRRPSSRAAGARIAPLQARLARGGRRRAPRFLDPDDEQQHGTAGGHDGDPERRLEVAGEPRHRRPAPAAARRSRRRCRAPGATRSSRRAARPARCRRSARRAARRGCPCRRGRRSAQRRSTPAWAPAERRTW